MAWIVVPNLLELRVQLNIIAPNRDKTSDGSIGDFEHSQGRSSHNPDDTSQGNAEWTGDSDSTQEVRAIDIDIDFNRSGLTPDEFVAHLVKYAKNGTFWWLRYIIYNRRIWRKNNGWVAESYTGTNPHDHHIHVNSDFTQAADNVSSCDYRLEELVEMPLTNSDADVILNRDGVPAAYVSSPLITVRSALKAATIADVQTRGLQTNLQAVFDLVSAVAAKVDLDQNEINAIKAAIVIPSPEENAEAVVEALGGVETEQLAETLRSVLGPEKTAELKAAL